jgi:Fe-S cluster assembly ATPase SufC
VQSGGPDLAEHLEEMGYDWIREQSREPVIEG